MPHPQLLGPTTLNPNWHCTSKEPMQQVKRLSKQTEPTELIDLLMLVQAYLKCGSPQYPSARTTEVHDHIGGAIVCLFCRTYIATTDSTKTVFRPCRADSYTINAQLQFPGCLHLPSNPQVWAVLIEMPETTQSSDWGLEATTMRWVQPPPHHRNIMKNRLDFAPFRLP